MKSKIFAISFLATVLALGLSGCGEEKMKETKNSTISTESEVTYSEESADSKSEQPDESTETKQTEKENHEGSDVDNPVTEATAGYKLYENEFFSTEIPEDWKVASLGITNLSDTLSEPTDETPKKVITVAGLELDDSVIDSLYQDYINSNINVEKYDSDFHGQPATVIDVPSNSIIRISRRTYYTSHPDGRTFDVCFVSPDSGAEGYDYSGIQSIMDHFIEHIEFK